jgi:hypothetical protein
MRKIKPGEMKWAGHVACMEDKRKCTRFWWENPKERDHFVNRCIDGSMGSELSWGDWLGVWSGYNWLRIGAGSGLL